MGNVLRVFYLADVQGGWLICISTLILYSWDRFLRVLERLRQAIKSRWDSWICKLQFFMRVTRSLSTFRLSVEDKVPLLESYLPTLGPTATSWVVWCLYWVSSIAIFLRCGILKGHRQGRAHIMRCLSVALLCLISHTSWRRMIQIAFLWALHCAFCLIDLLRDRIGIRTAWIGLSDTFKGVQMHISIVHCLIKGHHLTVLADGDIQRGLVAHFAVCGS